MTKPPTDKSKRSRSLIAAIIYYGVIIAVALLMGVLLASGFRLRALWVLPLAGVAIVMTELTRRGKNPLDLPSDPYSRR